MRRSKQLCLLALTIFAAPLVGAATVYHLELEANPAAPFPLFGKFGAVTLHVYPGGVRADTVWLNGFSAAGSPTVTVENPFGRMYTEVPVADIAGIVSGMAPGEVLAVGEPIVEKPVAGKVHGIPAARYRMVYGPAAWIDVWTTGAYGDNRQYRALVDRFVSGIAPSTASAWGKIGGMPIYVELNFRRFKKVPLLRVRSVSADSSGEEKALKTGPLYFRAPILDALWK